MADKLFVHLLDLSSAQAYLTIFITLVACGLGLPLPEDIPLIASGYLIWDGTFEIAQAILVTIGGVLLGDTILFILGHNLGKRFLEQEKVQTIFKPEKIRRTQAYFRKYGTKIVFFARFVVGFRAIAFFMAGTMGVSYMQFLLLDFLAAVISVPLWIAAGYGLGYYLGDEISQILLSIRHLKSGFIIILLSVVAFFIVRLVIKYNKAKELERLGLKPPSRKRRKIPADV